MEDNRLKNGIKIIEYAINNNKSIKKSCIENGYSSTYVKNIKMDLNVDKKNNRIKNRILFNVFFSLYEQYKEKYLNNQQKKENIKTTVIENDNGNDLSFSSEGNIKHIKTIDDLIERCNIDLNEWEINKCEVGKWDVSSPKNNSIIQNFKVKGFFKRKESEIKSKLALETFINGIKNYEPPKFDFEGY